MSVTLKYKQYVHIVITLCLMFFLRFMSPIGCITPLGMEILGVFLGLMYGWTFCGMIWPSLLGILFMGFSDYSTINNLLSAGAGHQTVLFLFFLYIFCGAIDESGVTEVIGQYIVSLRIGQGRPFILAFLLCFAAWIMGAFVSAVAAIILLWQVFSGVCTQLGYEKGEKYPKLVIIGIIYSGMIGSTVFPFKVYPVIMMGVYEATTGETIGFLPYTVVVATITFVLLILYIFLCKYVFRPKVNADIVVIEPPESLTSYQKKIIFVLISMVAAFFLPSILPADWGITIFLNTLGNNGIVVAVLVLCLLITDQGKPLLDVKKAIFKSMSWDIYFLVMAAFQLANAMTSDATGIKDFIVDTIGSVLGGHGALAFCFIVIAIGAIMANIISNVVTPMIMLPLITPFANGSGVDVAILTVLLCIVMMDSIILPSGSPVAGLLLANDWVETKDVYCYGSIILIMTIVICSVIGLPLATIILL